MSPNNIYAELTNIFPGISVTRYHKYKLSLNTIWFETDNGRRMIFTYFSPVNYCLRTEKYEKEVK